MGVSCEMFSAFWEVVERKATLQKFLCLLLIIISNLGESYHMVIS